LHNFSPKNANCEEKKLFVRFFCCADVVDFGKMQKTVPSARKWPISSHKSRTSASGYDLANHMCNSIGVLQADPKLFFDFGTIKKVFKNILYPS
jgi:hypothetical protein